MAAFKSRAETSHRQQHRHPFNRMRARRESIVAELALLRMQSGDSKIIDNAQQLLTRWWSTENLNARKNLLKAIEWLILLEKRRASGLTAATRLHDPS